jgi:hypothetical protein
MSPKREICVRAGGAVRLFAAAAGADAVGREARDDRHAQSGAEAVNSCMSRERSAAPDRRKTMNKLIQAVAAVAAVGMFPTAAHAGLMHYYRDSGGAVYKICRDSDGFSVYKPGGGMDAWGTGYTWAQVKAAYGLGAYYTRGPSYNPCP